MTAPSIASPATWCNGSHAAPEACPIEKEQDVYVNNLSYDPHDPMFDLPGYPGIQWGIQVFTVRNMYALHPDHAVITPEGDGLRLDCDKLSWAGQQQQSEGRVEAHIRRENGAVIWTVNAWHD